MKEPIFPTNLPKHAMGLYNICYLFFLAKQEFDFIKDDPMNQNTKRFISNTLQKSQNLNNHLVSIGLNYKEIFSEFSEEKRYAIHNILTLLCDKEERQVLEIETQIINLTNQ